MDLNRNNFYDGISSLLSPDACEDNILDDLDEIMRSADSQLGDSLNSTPLNDFCDILPNTLTEALTNSGINTWNNDYGLESMKQNESQFDFGAFPSPAHTTHSHGTPPHNSSIRTESISSLDGDLFNPDDFLNFLNDDDIKMEDTPLHRNTPSPAGSCTSSSGSSTSGVQSDASSMISASGDPKAVTMKFNKVKKIEIVPPQKQNEQVQTFITTSRIQEDTNDNRPEIITNNNNNKSIGLLRNNLINVTLAPISTMPRNTASTPQSSSINIATSTPLKIVKNGLVETIVPNVKPVKIIGNTELIMKTSGSAIHSTTSPPSLSSTLPLSTGNGNKPIQSPSVKAKTVYLSTNDFNVLMQKINNNSGSKKLITSNTAPVQMPKVIMKTTNGKLVAAKNVNNITATVTNPAPAQFKPYIMKVNSNALFKPPAPVQTDKFVTTNIGRPPNIQSKPMDKLSDVDEKLLKKQQRMLKNRESASLSRRKKKEYIESLEKRVSILEKENYTLKGENVSLRSQLMAFAQTCKCKNSNVSEFILNTLDISGQGNCSVLNAIDATTTFLLDNDNKMDEVTSAIMPVNVERHIKIAPKPPNAPANINKNFRTRLSATTVKKNVAVLFAMAFMVALNVGNFQNFLHKLPFENNDILDVTREDTPKVSSSSTGRHLLWVPTEKEFHENNNRTKRSIEVTQMKSPPPLHFLRPQNRTSKEKPNDGSVTTNDEPPLKITSNYGERSLSNVTKYMQENMRLVRDLHKWIGGNDYLNLSMNKNMDQVNDLQFDLDYANIHLPLQGTTERAQYNKRKLFMDNEGHDRKKPKLNMHEPPRSLDLFKPRISEEYIRLFKGIKRQDDTFYVLSFNMDHILLPASAYNKSARPKMSLMLPAGDPSLNGDIVLMQIDCEVVNTTELELKSEMIPEKMRRQQQRYDNYDKDIKTNQSMMNGKGENVGDTNNNKNNADINKMYESFNLASLRRNQFMMDAHHNNTMASNSLPVQTINANGKRKPLMKFNDSNNSALVNGILNVHNSMLFTKMKETVSTSSESHVNSITNPKHNLG